MKSDELMELCNKYIDSIDEEKAKILLRADNMLCRHNTLNRVLIDIQDKDKDISDVRTYEEWYVLGRRVTDRSKPIALLKTNKADSFYDVETNRKLGYGELSYSEIEEAIKAGIIRKDTRDIGTEVIIGYDFKYTEECDKGLYINRITPGLNLMSQISKKLYGFEYTVNKNNEDDRHIYVTGNVESAIDIIVDRIAGSNKDCNIEMMKYSLYTMFGIDKHIEFGVSITDIERTRDKMFKLVNQCLFTLGYVEQAVETISNVEESKRMLEIIKYMIYKRGMEV